MWSKNLQIKGLGPIRAAAPQIRNTNVYTGWSNSLCPWWLQYRKLQVMFKVSSASLQTFIDTPNCFLEDRDQYSAVHIPNVFCEWCTETFWSPCIICIKDLIIHVTKYAFPTYDFLTDFTNNSYFSLVETSCQEKKHLRIQNRIESRLPFFLFQRELLIIPPRYSIPITKFSPFFLEKKEIKLLGDALWVQEIKEQTCACASRGLRIILVLCLSFMNKQKNANKQLPSK